MYSESGKLSATIDKFCRDVRPPELNDRHFADNIFKYIILLAPKRHQAFDWTNDGTVRRCVSVTSLNSLNNSKLKTAKLVKPYNGATSKQGSKEASIEWGVRLRVSET